MTHEDHVFAADVVIIDPTREVVAISVINQLASAVVELSTIANICKYRRLHEGHRFNSMAMEVHGALGHDMDHFIKECVVFSMINNQKVIYLCLFAFSFSSNMLVLLFTCFSFYYRKEDCAGRKCLF
jgi:hypothetical protein